MIILSPVTDTATLTHFILQFPDLSINP